MGDGGSLGFEGVGGIGDGGTTFIEQMPGGIEQDVGG